jgi:superoxide reductase
MIKRNTIFKCQVCGNMVDLVHVGGGTLSCCGQPMTAQSESSADTTTEKHVPFIEKTDNGYLVRVGETVDHPMLDAHYIVWIELETDKGIYRKFLSPGVAPQALFNVGDEKVLGAREYCNLHGLWKG